jgi:hypothetical protein
MKAIIPRSFQQGVRKKTPTIALEYQQPAPDSTPEDALRTHSVDNVSQSVDTFDAEKDLGAVAKLDYETWLPFAAKLYKISPKIEDYIIVSTLVCPSDIPNRNGIAFPLSELADFRPPPTNRMAYKAWKGCPVHCFPAGTKIRTSKGLRNIEDIEPGMSVWTHRGRHRKVTHLINNGVQPLKEINALGLSAPIRVTDNHPVWIVDRRQVFSGTGVKDARYKQDVQSVTPHFRPVSDVYSQDYLVVSIAIGGKVSVDPNFAFLTGLYTAEGNLMPNNRSEDVTTTVLTIGYVEKELRERALAAAEALNLETSVRFDKRNNTCALHIRDVVFAHAMRDLVGVYSHKKRMKGELRKWDRESILNFLGGYISGDGTIKGSRLRCRTVSEDLAQDVQMAFGFVGIPASANNDAASWHTVVADSKYTREGNLRKNAGGKPWRPDNSSFCIGVSFDHVPQLMPYIAGKKFASRTKGKEIGPRIVVVDKFILLPISSIEDAGYEQVYNFEVEDDHTYVAGGVVVHNCEHDNEIHEKAYGVILDASLHKVEGYGDGKLWKVMGLLAIDKNKYPDVARKVLTKEINTYSMGALVDYFTCGYCGAECSAKHTCGHITSPKNVNWKKYRDFDGSTHLAFLNAHGLSPIECSIVKDPAWAPALSDNVLDPWGQSTDPQSSTNSPPV